MLDTQKRRGPRPCKALSREDCGSEFISWSVSSGLPVRWECRGPYCILALSKTLLIDHVVDSAWERGTWRKAPTRELTCFEMGLKREKEQRVLGRGRPASESRGESGAQCEQGWAKIQGPDAVCGVCPCRVGSSEREFQKRLSSLCKQQKLERVWRQGNSPALLAGMDIGVVTTENSVAGPPRTRIIELPYDPVIPLLGIQPEKSNSEGFMHLSVHRSTVYDSQDMEAT